MKFMKSIFRYIFFLVALVSLFACNEDMLVEDDVQGSEIVIDLSSVSMTTKADIPGVDELNENKIKSVHYFIYPHGKNQPTHWGILNNVNTNSSASVRLKVSDPVFNKVIFPRPYDECDVYVIVNLPSEVTIDDNSDKSLEYLQNIALKADFTKTTQNLFVMEGLGKIKVKNRAEENAAEGTIKVERVASKFTVKIKVSDSKEIDGVLWKASPDDMKMTFHNGVSNAVISADPEAIEPELFTLNSLAFTDAESQTSKEGYTTYECSQFYSYPIKWHVGENNEPYFKIELPWYHEVIEGENTVYKTSHTHYKVILAGDVLKRNTWTDITINISAPGSFDDFKEYNVIILDVTYKVVDWGEAITMNSEVLDSRYVVVDNNYYELNNQSELKIPISSSHDCMIANIKITRPNYKKETISTSTITWDDTKWTLRIEQSQTEGTYAYFHHKMNNDIKSKDIDFAPYTITFRVGHKDKIEDFYRDVTIVQNPAMMIVAEKNPGGNIVEDNKTIKSDDKGYVFVNNNQLVDWVNDSATNRWDLVRSCEDGGNSNPNMYLISTTVPFEDYVLTDTRKTTATQLTGSGGLFNGTDNTLKEDVSQRKLEYYYETIGGDESHHIMAPKFRIASSYGKCWSNIDGTKAKRRCAAYQELGYPAGRWRMPTPAEIRFIATLSNYGIIPKLFTDGNNYWTSDGIIKYGNDLSVTTATSGAVRCVYDDWYWEQTDSYKVPVNEFTWGDMER